MGSSRSSGIILIIILIPLLAYLFKYQIFEMIERFETRRMKSTLAGVDGNGQPIWMSRIYRISDEQPGWGVWDVPIPTEPGIYKISVNNPVASRTMSWTCTVSNQEYNISDFTSNNVGRGEEPMRGPIIRKTDRTSQDFVMYGDGADGFPSSNYPAFFGIDFNYNRSDDYYTLTMRKIYPPAPPPPIPCPACKPCPDMTAYMLASDCLFRKDDTSGKYMLSSDCNPCPPQQPIPSGIPPPNIGNTMNLPLYASIIKDNAGFDNEGIFAQKVQQVQKIQQIQKIQKAQRDRDQAARLRQQASASDQNTCPTCPVCPDMTPYILVTDCLFIKGDTSGRYMLSSDCIPCPPQQPIPSGIPTPQIGNNPNLQHFTKISKDNENFEDMYAKA